MSNRAQHQKEIDQLAADWVVRQETALSRAEQQALQDWLNASPHHQKAYAEAEQAWQLMSTAGDTETARPRRWQPLLAVAAVLIAAILLSSNMPMLSLQGITADYSTGINERRSITLADGSELELAPGSAIDVELNTHHRVVILRSGAAWFHPAPVSSDCPSAFIVRSGNTRTRALGTQFEVERLPDGEKITLIEHSIQVLAETPNDQSLNQILNAPGESLHYAENGGFQYRQRSPDSTASWRRNQLYVDAEPLGHVIARLNRYQAKRLVILDSELAAREISGIFDPRDQAGSLRTLTDSLPIRTLSLSPLLTLLY